MTRTSAAPSTSRTWSARLAAISSVSRSVTIATLSPGRTRRHVLTALRAPGIRSSAYAVKVPASLDIAMRHSFVRGSRLVRVRCRPHLRGCQGKAARRLFADVVHDLLEVAAALLVDAELAVGARPVSKDPVYSLEDLAARAELVDDVVDERQHLDHELAERHLDLLAEVDELALDAVPARAPFVLE